MVLRWVGYIRFLETGTGKMSDGPAKTVERDGRLQNRRVSRREGFTTVCQ